MNEAEIEEEQNIIDIEAAIQAGFEAVHISIDGEKLTLVEGLKALRKALGVDDDARANKTTVVGNTITVLTHFEKIVFRTTEQRESDKAAVAQRAEQEEEDEKVDAYRAQLRKDKAKKKGQVGNKQSSAAPSSSKKA